MMLRLRSVLSLLLVVITTFLVSCSSPSVTVPDTYTPDRLSQIEMFLIPVDEAREGMNTLGEFVQDDNWIDTRTYIHGPFGFLRRDLTYLANTLLPSDKAQAQELVDEIFAHLDRLDAAAKDNNAAVTNFEYRNAVSDFDAYLDLVPTEAS
ncbi:photosystem II protein PsbQ [[Leptolyngbya] sp. PCC 7376]|uniref:photosystem II protein PsbQ n=1 Tax=[Leptolyngbya] sp. PCC 7376 TaxID=111781 RepID=UPI00029F30C7|nr:photosystem II protein PsbQ [[Leptolyngbya] sp. PCC 7376]AFY38969.1 photosystem II protein PsbQ [[Leptolyngbya] sp. PCC 7376]